MRLVVGVGFEGAEGHHQAVTQEFVHPAVVPDCDLDHALEVLVQQADYLFRAALFGERGEAANVGEEDCDQAAVALKDGGVARLHHALQYGLRNIARERGFDALPLLQARRHRVDRGGQNAELVPARPVRPRGKVALADSRDRRFQRLKGLPYPPGQQQRGTQDQRQGE